MPEETIDVVTDIVLSVVQSIVETPERVSTEAVSSAGTVFITLRIAPDDVAKVEGPSGRTLRSLRTMVASLGRRFGQIIELDFQTDQQ